MLRAFVRKMSTAHHNYANGPAQKRRKLNDYSSARDTHEAGGKNFSEKGRSDDDVIYEAHKTNNLKRLNALINEAAKRKNFPLAKRVFDHIGQKELKPDLFSYTCLLNACVRSGVVEEAIQCFDKIIEDGLKPNEVTYTTLLRAFCSDEKFFDRATSLLASMKSNGVKPNDRTYATYLRCCFRFGKTEEGDKAFKEMKAAGIVPNASIVNLIIKIWAIGSQLDQALNMIENAEKAGNILDPSTILICASMAALAGRRVKVVETLLEKFDATLKNSATATNLEDDDNNIEERKERALAAAKAEHEFERKFVGDFLEAKKKGTLQHKPSSEEISAGPKKSQHRDVFFESNCDKEALSKLISSKTKAKLEICAGAGDWILSKCEADPASFWFALEIRYDRIHEIWRKLKMKGLSNLCILVGNAKSFTTLLPSNAFDEVYINFPEPIHTRESSRLIDEALIRTILEKLKSNGQMFVATDDKLYSECISEDLAKIHHSASAELSKKNKKAALSPKDFVKTELPSDFGNSFFDELWKSRGRGDRFFIQSSKK